MIKKLQIKFVAITMSITTIMLCIILGLVYYFTKNNIETSSISMMLDIANHPYQLGMPNESSNGVHLPYFVLLLDPGGDLIMTNGGYYDLSNEDFLTELVELTLSNAKYIDTIDDYHLRFCRVSTPLRETIVYSDISSELAMLRDLLRTCIIIGLISFSGFFFLSIWLAKWAVKPVNQAWQQQRQFTADASHELKTPLAVITANAELMQNPAYNEESRARFSYSILTMSKQMRRLVEQMLELASSDYIRTDASFSTVNFSRLVLDTTLLFEPLFYEKGLFLKTDIEENLIVFGDSEKLRQVIDILLDNAQKYSSRGGATLVSLKRRGRKRLLLSVANEGEEIPAQNLKNLFKRFYRADKARSHTASFGLGLSIAEAIITRYKGKIWADSDSGVNTFFIELRCQYSGGREEEFIDIN